MEIACQLGALGYHVDVFHEGVDKELDCHTQVVRLGRVRGNQVAQRKMKCGHPRFVFLESNHSVLLSLEGHTLTTLALKRDPNIILYYLEHFAPFRFPKDPSNPSKLIIQPQTRVQLEQYGAFKPVYNEI